MSLIHWWPLTGDLKDKITGVNLVQTTAGTASFITAGKIGTALASSDTYRTPLTLNDINPFTNHSFSFACWIKINQAEIQTVFNTLTTTYDIPTGSLLGYNNYGGIALTWRANSLANFQYIQIGGTMRGSSTLNTAWGKLPFDQWSHLALTQDANSHVMRLYLNGTQIGQVNFSSLTTISNNSQNVFINHSSISSGNGPKTTLPCQLNDVRIYDHALSQAEIQELKKALVLHYTFDDILAEPTTNYSNQGNWFSYEAYWTVKTENNIQKLTKSTNTEPTVALGNSTLLSQMNVGEIWTMSCYLYKEGQPFKTPVTMGPGSSQYGLIYELISSKSKDDGYFESTFKITQKTGSYIFHARLFGDSVATNTKCEIHQLQFEKKDHATPYTLSSRKSMLQNETGLTQPTKIENLSLTKETNNGIYAGNFNGDPYTLITTPLDLTGHTDLTVACWAFIKSSGTLGSKVIYHIVNGSSLDVYAYGRSNNWLNTSVPLNTWVHITVTYSATERTVYINGIEQKSDSISGTFTGTPSLDLGYDTSTSGRTFNGLISDYRIYTTCLSPTEIKELYNCGGRISNLGDALTGSFIEGAAAIKVNKNHTIETDEIIEQGEAKASFKKDGTILTRQIIEI